MLRTIFWKSWLLGFTIKLTIKLWLRNQECRFFSWSVRKQLRQVSRLVLITTRAFKSKEFDVWIHWHVQGKPGYLTHPDGVHVSEICWEAPLCLTLYLEDRPIAGMAVEFRGRTIAIRQLQGVSGVTIPENLRKCPAIFVNGVQEYVKRTVRFERVRIYAASERPGYRFPIGVSDEDLPIFQQKLRRRYDGTARQCGFKKINEHYWEWAP